MDVIIYGLKNCDTCRKALKALPDAQLHDVRVEGIPDAVMTAALAKFESALVNTRSTTWRGLNDQERQELPQTLLKANPALMKRPLIKAGKILFLSWDSEIEDQVKALL
jgi:arsenate reductase